LILNPEALGIRVNGKMYGYGLYFASAFSKSFNYCDSGSSNGYAALLLCDVGIGTPSKRTKADYNITKAKLKKEKCDSVWAIGKTSMGEPTKLNGVIVPNGKLIKSNIKSDLLYDEFIVYDANQVSLKYLIIVKRQ
jgi:hypothetical protein